MNPGERAVKFIENLRHSKGRFATQPFHLLGWQRDFVQKLFGQVDEQGRRIYKDAFLFIPRKNGKTQLASAIALYAAFTGEQGGEVYSCSNDRDQASISFQAAVEMIRGDKHLMSLVKIIDSRKTIRFKHNNAIFRALSSEAGTKHGYNPSVVIYDELHEAENNDLYDVMRSGMGARTEPLFIVTTTAGWSKESLCYRQYEYAKAVANGTKVDPTFLPAIYEMPEGGDWQNEDNWIKANPSLGQTVGIDWLRTEYKKCIEVPSEQWKFRRLYLNEWTQADRPWLDPAKWETCGKNDFDFNSLKGKDCWVGCDFSATVDITAFVLVFKVDGRWVIIPKFYVPRETARKKELIDKVPYLTWIEQGHIMAIPGDVMDYDMLRAELNRLKGVYNIREVAIDRWNTTQITNQLTTDGFTVVPFGQTYGGMTSPCKEIERAVTGLKLLHPNHPVMNWMVSNTVPKYSPQGDMMLDKSKGERSRKIDGVVAMAMGIGRAMASPSAGEQYAGLLVI